MDKTTQPLYDIIKSAVKDGVLPDDFTLPHDPLEKISFADGAMDGIGIYHMGASEITDEIRTLGLCDEFTLFVVFIILRWENGNSEVFELAKKVHGWGRIHAVERLEPETDEIKKWFLREGCKNCVMPAYSALTCWNKSGAAELLRSGEPLSNKDFKGLCGLFDALLDEGPCAGISEVENADEMLELFLNKASGRELDIDDYEVVRNIRDYDGENGKVAALCSDIIKSEKCRERVKLAVKDGKAIELANEHGIDYFKSAGNRY